MIEEILWLLFGFVAGIVTGLFPGIHANTAALLALYVKPGNPLGFALFVVSMSITHSFVDAIPSILLGAPSGESSLNLLPGHEMLLQGKGLEAIQLTVFGGLLTGIFTVILLPFFFSFAKNYGNQLPIVIPAFIAVTVILMVIDEKNKPTAIAIIALSGLAGQFLLNAGIHEAIFALVVGFFAIPGLCQAALSNTKIPPQEKTCKSRQKISFGLVSAATSGVLAAFPGIGPSQAAAIVKSFLGKISKSEYLILSGGINIGNLFFSILMLYALGKTRTGMAAIIDSVMEIDGTSFAILAAGAVASVGVATAVTEIISPHAITMLQRINYRKSSIAIASALGALVLWICGPAGLAASLVAAGIGFCCIGAGVKRGSCMGFLLLPTFLFYTGIGF